MSRDSSIVALLRQASRLSNQHYHSPYTNNIQDERRFREVRRIVRRARGEEEEEKIREYQYKPTQMSELLVEGARVLLHENDEYVSIENVESLIRRSCGGVPLETLGMKRTRHTVHGHQLERMQLTLDRVIRDYLISRPLCVLADLEDYICDSFRISAYENLRVGPLSQHPLLRGSVFHVRKNQDHNRGLYSPILNWSSSIFVTPDQAQSVLLRTLRCVLETRRIKMLSRGFRKICFAALQCKLSRV